MAKNLIASRRDHPLKFVERWLKNKSARRMPERMYPLDEPVYPTRPDHFKPEPQTGVVTIPLTGQGAIYQAGFIEQGGDRANLPTVRAGQGIEGGDCLLITADNQGIHHTHASTMLLNDSGSMRVWVRGLGSAHQADYEYVMSVHHYNDDATPVDVETLIIRWEPDEGELRLYPNLSEYPTTFVSISLNETDWQDSGEWHLIEATWSYQTQEWTLSWDTIEGVLNTPATPDIIPWPKWDEATQLEMFTDLDYTNHIGHNVQFLQFGQIVGGEAEPWTRTYITTYTDYVLATPNLILPDAVWITQTYAAVSMSGQPDIPKRLILTTRPIIPQTMIGTIEITGINADGVIISESFDINDNVQTERTTDNAFLIITEIDVVVTGGDNRNRFDVGTTRAFGVGNIETLNSIYRLTIGGVYIPATAYAVDYDYGVITPTTEPNAGENLVVYSEA